MVRLRLLISLLMVLLPLAATAASPQLILQAHKTEVQLGHAMPVELIGISLPGKLFNIDLAPLAQDFGVIIEETLDDVNDPRWPGQNVQKISLVLYPRRIGDLTLPQLQLGEAHTSATHVQIIDGILKSRAGNTRIRQSIEVSTRHPWQRQQVIVAMEINTKDSYASLNSDESPTIPGFEVYRLGAENIGKVVQADGTVTLHMAWALFPLISGQHTVELPPVEYRKSGRVLRTYFLPQQHLDVKSLPPYIPPTMPVGKIDIADHLKQEDLLDTNTLAYWDVTLWGTGISPRWLPPVLGQVKSNDDILFFPASSKRKLERRANGLSAEVRHHIPFKALANGKLSLPVLELQYFDPENGKISLLKLTPKTGYVLSTSWRAFLLFFCAMVMAWLVRILFQRIRSIVQRRANRRAAIAEIHQAKDMVALRKSLNRVAEAEGWPENLSIRDWKGYWRKSFQPDDKLSQIVDDISKSYYGHGGMVDASGYRSQLIGRLRHSWGV